MFVKMLHDDNIAVVEHGIPCSRQAVIVFILSIYRRIFCAKTMVVRGKINTGVLNGRICFRCNILLEKNENNLVKCWLA